MHPRARRASSRQIFGTSVRRSSLNPRSYSHVRANIGTFAKPQASLDFRMFVRTLEEIAATPRDVEPPGLRAALSDPEPPRRYSYVRANIGALATRPALDAATTRVPGGFSHVRANNQKSLRILPASEHDAQSEHSPAVIRMFVRIWERFRRRRTYRCSYHQTEAEAMLPLPRSGHA